MPKSKSSVASTLGFSALGVIAAIGGRAVASIGLEPISWSDIVGILLVPAVAFLRPPVREGIAFLWLTSAGVVVVTDSIGIGEFPSMYRGAFGIALFAIAYAVFRRGKRLRRALDEARANESRR